MFYGNSIRVMAYQDALLHIHWITKISVTIYHPILLALKLLVKYLILSQLNQVSWAYDECTCRIHISNNFTVTCWFTLSKVIENMPKYYRFIQPWPYMLIARPPCFTCTMTHGFNGLGTSIERSSVYLKPVNGLNQPSDPCNCLTTPNSVIDRLWILAAAQSTKAVSCSHSASSIERLNVIF